VKTRSSKSNCSKESPASLDRNLVAPKTEKKNFSWNAQVVFIYVFYTVIKNLTVSFHRVENANSLLFKSWSLSLYLKASVLVSFGQRFVSRKTFVLFPEVHFCSLFQQWFRNSRLRSWKEKKSGDGWESGWEMKSKEILKIVIHFKSKSF